MRVAAMNESLMPYGKNDGLVVQIEVERDEAGMHQ